MKKILLLISVFVAVCFYSNAQDFVKYSGDVEKNLVTNAKTADDFVKLSIASELSDVESGILYDNFIQQIKDLNLQTIAGDKSGRHLKKVYDAVHDHFLKKYNPSANFGDFITKGEYNHITATILFAYVLENLGVSYHITQYPAHIFVTAGADNVKFETIDPATGVYFIDASSKQKNVINLIKAGYIDQSYAIKIGVEKSFDEFMYDKEDLTLKETVGILYFEKALADMEAEVAPAAYSNMCKADILFPDNKDEYFKNIALLSMVDNFKYDDIADWHAMAHLVNARDATENFKNYTIGEFQNLMTNKLLNAGQKDKVAEVYNYMHANVKDTAVKKQIAKIYFYESANYNLITNNYDDALDCLEVAYGLDPHNPIIISNLENVITHKYGFMPPTTQNLLLFDTYVTQHPALENYPTIAHIYEYFYGVLGNEAFIKGNNVSGEKYLKLITDELDAHPEAGDERNNIVIAGIFSSASTYYFKKQQRQKAIEILKAGIKYVPTDEELQRKLTADSKN